MELDTKSLVPAVLAVLGLGGANVYQARQEPDCTPVRQECIEEKREIRDFCIESRSARLGAGVSYAIWARPVDACPPWPCADDPESCGECECSTELDPAGECVGVD